MKRNASSFDLSVCPHRAFYVRKRRKAGHTYLIRLSEIFLIDDLGEAIWLLCDGKTPVIDMVSRLAPAFPQLGGLELLQTVARSVLFMLQRDLIEPWEKGTLPAAVNRHRYLKPLAELMQAFHRDKHVSWEQRLLRETAEKVQTRFFRICYESYWASMADKRRALSERAFQNLWNERFLVNQSRAITTLATDFGIRSWRFDVSTNRIVIVIRNTVYEGDIDNRF